MATLVLGRIGDVALIADEIPHFLLHGEWTVGVPNLETKPAFLQIALHPAQGAGSILVKEETRQRVEDFAGEVVPCGVAHLG